MLQFSPTAEGYNCYGNYNKQSSVFEYIKFVNSIFNPDKRHATEGISISSNDGSSPTVNGAFALDSRHDVSGIPGHIGGLSTLF
jgi:hypothetical protein